MIQPLGYYRFIVYGRYTLQLVGGFNNLEKYESQLGLLFPIYGKNKNKKKVPGRYTYRYRYIWLFCGYIWLVWVYLAISIPTIVYGRYTYSNLMAGRSIIGIGIYRITYKWPIQVTLNYSLWQIYLQFMGVTMVYKPTSMAISG